MALGVQEDLSPFHAMADIYLEGFPFGSLTALLEAGLSGLPCVGAPAVTPLPLRSDDIAMDAMQTPASVEDYISQALRLAGDARARSLEGERTQKTIWENHCGAGWMRRLSEVYDRIPERHALWARTSQPVSNTLRDYWVSFQRGDRGTGMAEVLTSLHRNAESKGLPLEGELNKCLDSDLLAFASRPNTQTSRNSSWLCEVPCL